MSVAWPSVRLGGATTKIGSGATPKGGETSYHSEGTPLIRSMNVIFFGFKRAGIAYLDEVQASALSGVSVEPNDVLLNITGASIGRVTVAPADLAGARVNQHVCIIRPTEVLEPRFLSAFLSSPAMQTKIGGDHYGVTRQALTKAQIVEFRVPCPPRIEQQRIADKLDAVLARVDACRERLDCLPGILKRFRQSVLAAATSGGLTEEWREQRGASDDWLDCDIQAVAQVGTGSTPLRSNQNFFASTGTPWITSAATSQSVVLFANEYVTEAAIAAHRLKKFPVGTLLVAMYGEGKTRGQVTELGIEATINQACAAVVVDTRRAMRSFVKLALQANYLEMRELAEGGNQPNLNLSKVKSFPLSLPSMAEQAEIVRRVESLFAWADRVEARHVAACAQVERLAPSLLAKAFRGELVPQDPADEPDSDLLKRLTLKPSAIPNAPMKRNGPKPQRAKPSRAASNVREESSS